LCCTQRSRCGRSLHVRPGVLRSAALSLSARTIFIGIVRRVMRILFTLLITAGVVTIHVMDNPQRFRALWERFSTRSEALLSDKEIRIEGLNNLSRTEIERLLPLDKSVAWWHANATELQSTMEQNPWINEASVSACPDTIASRWGCFVLSIKERIPTFSATVDNSQWVIDREGSFMVPLGDLRTRGISADLIAVKGLASRSISPDLVRGQLAAASRLLSILEREVGRAIASLEFQGQGDFSVLFKGLSFPIVFAAGKDAKISLSEQGVRCAELLKRLSNRLTEITKIDLAFERVGVVSFAPTPLPTPAD